MSWLHGYLGTDNISLSNIANTEEFMHLILFMGWKFLLFWTFNEYYPAYKIEMFDTEIPKLKKKNQFLI